MAIAASSRSRRLGRRHGAAGARPRPCPCLPTASRLWVRRAGRVRDAAGDGLERDLRGNAATRRVAAAAVDAAVGGMRPLPARGDGCRRRRRIYTGSRAERGDARGQRARRRCSMSEIIVERQAHESVQVPSARAARLDRDADARHRRPRRRHRESVAAGLGRALANDALAASWRLRVMRICCFDRSHAPIFREQSRIAPFLENVFLGQPAAGAPLTRRRPSWARRAAERAMGLWLADGPVRSRTRARARWPPGEIASG